MFPQQRLAFYHFIVARGNSHLREENDVDYDGGKGTNTRRDFHSSHLFTLSIQAFTSAFSFYMDIVCCSVGAGTKVEVRKSSCVEYGKWRWKDNESERVAEGKKYGNFFIKFPWLLFQLLIVLRYCLAWSIIRWYYCCAFPLLRLVESFFVSLGDVEFEKHETKSFRNRKYILKIQKIVEMMIPKTIDSLQLLSSFPCI